MGKKYFAVGDWISSDGKCKCPIDEAAMSHHNFTKRVAQDYDDRAKDKYDVEKGEKITENKAKKIWNNMIKHYRDVVGHEDREINHMHERKLELAKLVKEKLGW